LFQEDRLGWGGGGEGRDDFLIKDEWKSGKTMEAACGKFVIHVGVALKIMKV